jgi:Tfp pilus assembly protein PilV
MRARLPNTPAEDETGFSLVEVMIMLVLLVVGVLALARLFPMADRGVVRDRLRTEAAYYLQQQVESLRSKQVNDPDLAAGRHPSDTSNEVLGTKGRLSRYWTVSTLGPPLDNVQCVSVVVRWLGPTGADSIVCATYVNH